MTREEHYAEGERLLAKSKDDNQLLKGEWRIVYATQAQAHFLAALAYQPSPVTRESVIVGGVIQP